MTAFCVIVSETSLRSVLSSARFPGDINRLTDLPGMQLGIYLSGGIDFHS